MSKKQDLKRKAQLSVKARMESFRFQVTWEKNQKMPEIPDEAWMHFVKKAWWKKYLLCEIL